MPKLESDGMRDYAWEWPSILDCPVHHAPINLPKLLSPLAIAVLSVAVAGDTHPLSYTELWIPSSHRNRDLPVAFPLVSLRFRSI